MTQIEKQHADMVSKLVKDPEIIRSELTISDVNTIHAILGIAGEAGELVDAVKKASIYDQHLDHDNIIEELGDLEFYMEQLRQELNISREETLSANMIKLAKRYPNYSYSDDSAKERADKKDITK